MSELKATTVYDAYWKANSVGEGTGIQVYIKSEADKVIAHQKYKRCLNKAEWCEERCARYDLLQEHSGFSWRREIDFYFRWYQRWLELAEKFKEKAK